MTVLAQLYLNESAELDFGVEIFGTESNSLDARFIIEGPQFGIICKCEESDGKITARVPKLESILPPGTYSSRLEVIVDGKHFRPLTENIKFNQPVSVTASADIKPKQENVVKVNTGKIHVRMSEEKVTAKPLTRDEIKNKSFTGYVDRSVIFNESTEEDAEVLRMEKLVEMKERMREYEKKLSEMKYKSRK